MSFKNSCLNLCFCYATCHEEIQEEFRKSICLQMHFAHSRWSQLFLIGVGSLCLRGYRPFEPSGWLEPWGWHFWPTAGLPEALQMVRSGRAKGASANPAGGQRDEPHLALTFPQGCYWWTKTIEEAIYHLDNIFSTCTQIMSQPIVFLHWEAMGRACFQGAPEKGL